MEKFEKFEVGKTYIFYNGAAHFRGIITKRTAKTITVKFSDKGTCHLHNLLYLEDAANVAPTTLRIVDRYANCEYAVTRKAGNSGRRTVDANASMLAVEQM